MLAVAIACCLREGGRGRDPEKTLHYPAWAANRTGLECPCGKEPSIRGVSRRDFLSRAAAISAGGLPTIVSARSRGREPGVTAAAVKPAQSGRLGRPTRLNAPVTNGIECRYANGTTPFLDFLPKPFVEPAPNWNNKVGICPVKFIGSDGWVETGDTGVSDLLDEQLRTAMPPAEKVPKGIEAALHARDFFDSFKSRRPTICNADVMRKSHLACHAAALAWILGRPLALDPARGRFTRPDGADDEANQLRSRPERDPWT